MVDMFLFRRPRCADEDWRPTGSDELIYWRNAGHIRRWIVEHTDYNKKYNCVYHILTPREAEKLLADCEKALASKKPDRVIPPSKDDKFGCTDVDESYINGLKITVSKLSKVIKSYDHCKYDIIYYERW